jgi:hypothetical protein
MIPVSTHVLPSRTHEEIRSRNMQLIPEALARAQYQDMLRLAEQERIARQVIRARRLKRKAESTGWRARRVLAAVLA